jgi:hypothetical protein
MRLAVRAASGSARARPQPPENALLSIIQAAGWPIWPLILCSVVALALIIDRRSFLTAALVYIALVISWIIEGRNGTDFESWAIMLIVLGALVTVLGTWWVPLRSALMRALPDFPGKRRLPPYAEKA